MHKQQNDGSFPCGSVLAFQSQHPKKYTDVYAAGEQSDPPLPPILEIHSPSQLLSGLGYRVPA